MIGIESDIPEKMARLRIALQSAEDGKLIKREVSKKLRGLVKPLADEMRLKVRSLPSKGHAGESMRQAVARQTRPATRWSGKNIGVSVIQRSRGMPRNFRMAGRMFNREEGWSPKTLGGATVHQQMEPSRWFDNTTKGVRPKAQVEMRRALEQAADTIARRAS